MDWATACVTSALRDTDPRQNFEPSSFKSLNPLNMPKFVPRQRKHKVIARRKQSQGENADANTAEILPQEERERADKKSALKADLLREAQGKISGKKKKRLDKYIVCVGRGYSISHSFTHAEQSSKYELTMFRTNVHLGYQAQERGEP